MSFCVGVSSALCGEQLVGSAGRWSRFHIYAQALLYSKTVSMHHFMPCFMCAQISLVGLAGEFQGLSYHKDWFLN